MRPSRITFPLLFFLWFNFVSLPLATPARGQGTPPGPLHPNPGAEPEKVPAPAEQKDQEKGAIRVRVSEVTVPVAVRDRSGELVFSLTAKDFHVYDNGVEQKIEHFDFGGEPLSVVLAVETSSRIEPMLPAVRQTGIVFTETVMGQTAEGGVIGFDGSVQVLEKFTTDVDEIQDTINRLPMGDSGARVYDAMWRGVSLLEECPTARRRILVVVGEAHDQGSEKKLGEVLREAQLANVTIYSISLSTTLADLRAKTTPYQASQIGPPGTYPVPVPNGETETPENEERAQGGNIDLLALAIWLVRTGKNAITPNALAVASKATGGLDENVKKDSLIEKAMDEIGGELHAEYTLGYRPVGTELTGYHEIKVKVGRPNVTVRTRPGYYIAPPEP
jgi:VWFA-related protein